jgi:hypothetical protein
MSINLKRHKDKSAIPHHVGVWADYDPTAPRSEKWAFYATKSEQRANRPDLAPIRMTAIQGHFYTANCPACGGTEPNPKRCKNNWHIARAL